MFFKVVIMVLFTFFISQPAFPAGEYATFEVFYKESNTFDWPLAAMAAIAAGATVFFTGSLIPLSAPFLTSIGTWLGNYMGFSGAAATNAGLAYLGGGSIAAGGFGKIGGMSLLSIALTFSNQVRLEYAMDIIGKYNYSRLAEESISMPTLPIPINKAFSPANEVAISYLKKVHGNESRFTENNQKIINQTIIYLEKLAPSEKGINYVNRQAFLALLYFIKNDFVNARSYAEQSIIIAIKYNARHTLPSFIYATCALYDESINFDQITDGYFYQSIINEVDNPLIPLMFTIYMDRMLLRLNDGMIDGKSLAKIFRIMNLLKAHQIVKHPKSVSMDVVNYTALVSRYFMLIKLEQQKMLSLMRKEDWALEVNLTTIETIENSLNNYRILMVDTEKVMTKLLEAPLDFSQKINYIKLRVTLNKYQKDDTRLESLLNELKRTHP